MKNIIIKFLGIVLSVMFFANYSIQVVAASPIEKMADNEGYFYFINDNSKINSDGSFTFSYSWVLTSSMFHPNSSTCSMKIRATCSTGTRNYYFELQDALTNTKVGNYSFTKSADGTYYWVYFQDLDPNTDYQLYFNDTNPFYTGTITGDGQLYNVTVY